MGADQQRLDDTFKYIRSIPEIGNIDQMWTAHHQDLRASKAISLGFPGILTKQKIQQRHALRSLLLCLYWCNKQNLIINAKRVCAHWSELDLQDAVRSFFPIPHSSVITVLKAVNNYTPNIGGGVPLDLYPARRGEVTANRIGISGNCYGAVTTWLYLGGVVSLKWMAQYGSQPGIMIPQPWAWSPETKNLIAAQNTPPGMICRFRRLAGGLHYTLSVGNGNCVGLNQSNDACNNWINSYGPRPTTTRSKFSIAGYLATMLAGTADVGLMTAPCVPSNLFRF